jgi:hypothetical protein
MKQSKLRIGQIVQLPDKSKAVVIKSYHNEDGRSTGVLQHGLVFCVSNRDIKRTLGHYKTGVPLKCNVDTSPLDCSW